MKMYILFFAAFITLPSIAQNNVAGKMGHSEVVEVAGATAQTLTSRANAFMSSKRIEAKTVANTISGIGTFLVSYTSAKKGPESGHVKFDVKIMVKDGKYKMELTDFRHEGIQGKSAGGSIDLERPICGETQITTVAWAKIKEQAQEQLKSFVQDMKIKMDNPVKAAPASNDF